MKMDLKKIHHSLDFIKLVSEMNDAYYIVKEDGVIIDANERSAELFGVELDRLIGMNVVDFWIIGTYKDDSYAFGYQNFSPTELLNYLSELDLLNVNQTTNVQISMLAFERQKTTSCLCKLGNSDKIVLPLAIPFCCEGERYVCTVTRELTKIMDLNNKIVDLERSLSKLKATHLEKKRGVFESPVMMKIDYLVNQIADSNITILITGDTGTGKEIISNEIYSRSNRNGKPFIKVNCAAIPETLFESELFGYEKGAFTGAKDSSKRGFLEQAHEGTILFDEIGDLPLLMQAKLLRVLQERKITRIGGEKVIDLDVRIIAATNKNLKKLVEEGSFRIDLYYRLNVVTIVIPPLANRPEDIIPLAVFFLEKYNKMYNKNKYFDFHATDEITKYTWPGNVRELENMIEKLVVIGEKDSITNPDVAIAIYGTDYRIGENNYEGKDLKSLISEIEKGALQEALKTHRSSRSIAKALGISQPTVLRKLKQYELN